MTDATAAASDNRGRSAGL